MYTQKIGLQKALELESAGKIIIVSTAAVNSHVHENEINWMDNYLTLRSKAPHVNSANIFNHFPTPYLIEHLLYDAKYSSNWIFFRGVMNPDPSSISHDNVEYVYILTNDYYKDLVKIGMTIKSPESRLDSINSTGVVKHWKLAFSIPLLPGTSFKVEQQVHKSFASRRYHAESLNDKEMFNVSLQEAIDSVRSMGQYFAAGTPKFYN
jgi:hypothetical protein